MHGKDWFPIRSAGPRFFLFQRLPVTYEKPAEKLKKTALKTD
jgi:hypothetical protein